VSSTCHDHLSRTVSSSTRRLQDLVPTHIPFHTLLVPFLRALYTAHTRDERLAQTTLHTTLLALSHSRMLCPKSGANDPPQRLFVSFFLFSGGYTPRPPPSSTRLSSRGASGGHASRVMARIRGQRSRFRTRYLRTRMLGEYHAPVVSTACQDFSQSENSVTSLCTTFRTLHTSCPPEVLYLSSLWASTTPRSDPHVCQ
jgi:hypothetical protein